MPALKNIFLSVLLLTGNIISYLVLRKFRTQNVYLDFLSTVASKVKGDSSTVTLFNVVVESTVSDIATPTFVSAIDVEPNGGTAYVEEAGVTVTLFDGSPLTTAASLTFVEAASWLYVSILDKPNDIISFEENCTLRTGGTMAECIDIARITSGGVETLATTTSFAAPVVPLFTLTVSGPTPTSSSATTSPTSSSAATILDNPLLNRLPSVFLGILVIVMLF